MSIKTGGGGGLQKSCGKAFPKMAQMIKMYFNVHVLVYSKTHMVVSY